MPIHRKITLFYVVVVAGSIGYELAIRILHRGSSELAGLLSTFVTLPSSLVLIKMTSTLLHERVSDSDVIFVTNLGLAGLLNTAILYTIVRRVFPSVEKRG